MTPSSAGKPTIGVPGQKTLFGPPPTTAPGTKQLELVHGPYCILQGFERFGAMEARPVRGVSGL